ncbi:hypothetical protein B0H14DRAFT_2631490 [Mycena olivaceomarginata]|nr:hypothetical protein B0H14DRAFT_2631490 [Mycena olivaceomarginata]
MCSSGSWDSSEAYKTLEGWDEKTRGMGKSEFNPVQDIRHLSHIPHIFRSVQVDHGIPMKYTSLQKAGGMADPRLRVLKSPVKICGRGWPEQPKLFAVIMNDGLRETRKVSVHVTEPAGRSSHRRRPGLLAPAVEILCVLAFLQSILAIVVPESELIAQLANNSRPVHATAQNPPVGRCNVRHGNKSLAAAPWLGEIASKKHVEHISHRVPWRVILGAEIMVADEILIHREEIFNNERAAGEFFTVGDGKRRMMNQRRRPYDSGGCSQRLASDTKRASNTNSSGSPYQISRRRTFATELSSPVATGLVPRIGPTSSEGQMSASRPLRILRWILCGDDYDPTSSASQAFASITLAMSQNSGKQLNNWPLLAGLALLLYDCLLTLPTEIHIVWSRPKPWFILVCYLCYNCARIYSNHISRDNAEMEYSSLDDDISNPEGFGSMHPSKHQTPQFPLKDTFANTPRVPQGDTFFAGSSNLDYFQGPAYGMQADTSSHLYTLTPVRVDIFADIRQVARTKDMTLMTTTYGLC